MDLERLSRTAIKSAREVKNLTQEELAALVNLSPTHVSVIKRLESYKIGYLCCNCKWDLDVSADLFN